MSELRLELSQTDLNKLRNFERKQPLLFQDLLLRKQIGQLLASQAKENINEGSPDGKEQYQELSEKYWKYKGFTTVLIGRKKNSETKKGKISNKGKQSGLLRKSLGFQVGEKSTIYLSMMNYGKYHQFEEDRTIISWRPIFTIRKKNNPDIMNFIQRAYTRLVNQTN